MILKLLAVLLIGVLFSLFILYNNKIKNFFLDITGRLDRQVSKHVGSRLKARHDTLQANAQIRKESTYNVLTAFYDDILTHLGFRKSGVNVLSFVTFIFILSVTLAIITMFFLTDIFVVVLLIFVYFFMITVLFKFVALTRYEEIENMMMEAQDLIIMGVDNGVKNAITRYTPSLHPTIRPYFQNFLTNIEYEGYSFNEAMQKLNTDLGRSFNSFANACIEYEGKGDDKTREIFSPIVDENEIKRQTRETGNRAFLEIRLYFLLSVGVTVAFALFLILTDDSAYKLLFETTFGRVMLIIDLVIIIAVLAFITMIKAQLLR